MYYNYYKKQAYLLIAGILLMICSYIFEFKGILFAGITINTQLQILVGIFFALTMFYYYKIICVLHKVTDITGFQAFIAVFSHMLTLISLYIFGKNKVIQAKIRLELMGHKRTMALIPAPSHSYIGGLSVKISFPLTPFEL